MSSYIEGRASKRCLCRWKCVNCGEAHVGLAMITARASQGYGLIGYNKEGAAAKVKEVTEKEIAKTFRKVNEKHIVPENLEVAGKCEKCGKVQPWASKNKYGILRGLISFIVSIFIIKQLYPVITYFIDPSEDSLIAAAVVFSVLLLTAGVLELSKWLIEFILLKKSEADRGECYPVLIEPPAEKKN